MKSAAAIFVLLTVGTAHVAWAQSASQGPYKGLALKLDGKPAAGAQVGLVYQDTKGWSRDYRSVSADATGHFDFGEVPRTESNYPRTLVLVVEGEGLAWIDLWDRSFPDTIQASEPCVWRVKVSDANATPLAGVSLQPRTLVNTKSIPGAPAQFLSLPPDLAAQFGATTNGQGSCTLKGLPKAATVGIETTDQRYAQPGYAQQLQPDGTADPTGTIELSLGARISGKVCYPDGTPAAGVRVGAQGASGLSDGWGSAISGADGEYTIHQLIAGTYNIALALEGGLEREWTARAFENKRLDAGSTTSGLNFSLERGAVLQGTVLDSSGNLAAGVHMGVHGPAHPQSGAWVQSTQTDAQGRYFFRVPAGKQYLYVAEADTNQSATFTVADGETVERSFSLPIRYLVRGRVVDVKGQPVEDAEIYATPPDSDTAQEGITKTDKAGQFELPGNLSGGTIRARKGKDGTSSAAQLSDGMELTLTPGALIGIDGRVLDGENHPISRAFVMVLADGGNGSRRVVAQCETSPDGRFMVDGMYPDWNLEVHVEAEGFSPATIKTSGSPLGITQRPTLKLAEAHEELSGIVVDEDGRPVPDVWVRVNGYHRKTATTDKFGRFLFTGMPKGELRLDASLGMASGFATGHAGTEVRLVLTKSDRNED